MLATLFLLYALVATSCGRSSPRPSPPLDYKVAILEGKMWISNWNAELAFKQEILELLQRQQFDALEKLFADISAHSAYLHGGWTGRDIFFQALRRPMPLNDVSLTRHGARVIEWTIEKPKSSLPLLVAATATLEDAVRNPADRQLWETALKNVRVAVAAAPKDPYPWCLYMEIAAVTHGSRAALDKGFNEAVKCDRYCYPAYYQKMAWLLDNGADHQEILAFLDAAVEATRDKQGCAFYALLVWHFWDRLHMGFTDSGLSWQKTRQGFLDFGRLWPEATDALNAFAAMAHRASEDGLARVLFARIGTAWDLSVWKDRTNFEKARKEVEDVPATVDAADIAYTPALVPRLVPLDMLSSSLQSTEVTAQLNSLMLTGNYAALEEIAAALRKLGPWYQAADSCCSLSGFYEALGLDDSLDDNQCQAYINALSNWKGALPESITARIAIAKALVGYGWKARGTGYADTVTPEGRRLFAERLSQARTELEAGEKLGQDPEWFYVRQIVGRGEGTDRASMEQLFNRAVERYPLFLPLYLERATQLLPRWGGAPGEMESAVEAWARRTTREMGMGLYACVAGAMHSYYERGTFFKQTKFQWALIRQGIKDLLLQKHVSLSPAMLLSLKALAFQQKDQETAVKCLEALKKTDMLAIASTEYGARITLEAWKRGVSDPDTLPNTASCFEYGVFSQETTIPRLLQTTSTVHIKDGMVFGVVALRGRLSDRPVKVRYVTQHPPYHKPDGTVEIEGSDIDTLTSANDIKYLYRGCFLFDHAAAPWEWVPGKYTFLVYMDGHKVFERTFTVVKP